MDKLKLIDEFLDYGGNELFSSLMGSDAERSEGIDRLVQLLQLYSDSCPRVKGRSAAYRFMLKKAQRNGWLGRGSKDLKSNRLTREERDHIAKRLEEYISSGGRNMQIIKKLLIIAAIAVIAGLFAYITVHEFQKTLGQVTVSANAYTVCPIECDRYL